MLITKYIVETAGLNLLDEPTDSQYKMFNTGGVECEVGEFLYSIVRLLKPKNILETGTHYGISSTYFALGLEHNNLNSKIITIDGIYYDQAKLLHKKLNLEKYIDQKETNSLTYTPDRMFDIILLDTEPGIRFDEFIKYYDNLNENGIIIIHDLHSNLSYNIDQKINDMYHWPYGDFRVKLGKYILENKVQIFSLPTPRGITLFQKPSSNMAYIKYIKNTLI